MVPGHRRTATRAGLLPGGRDGSAPATGRLPVEAFVGRCSAGTPQRSASAAKASIQGLGPQKKTSASDAHGGEIGQAQSGVGGVQPGVVGGAASDQDEEGGALGDAQGADLVG